MGQFGRVSFAQGNPGEAASPTALNDSTQGYSVGSSWYDTRSNLFWTCNDATPGAAKWIFIQADLIGRAMGANMNVTTDQPFVMSYDVTLSKFAVSKILVTNASVSLTTAAGGVYSAATKGGTAIVAAAQVYTALTAATSLLALTIAAAGSASVFSVAPILSLTTAQGAAATADFYLFGNVLPLA